MLGIGTEISIFLQSVLAGSIVALTYCTIRVFRRIIKHNLFFVSLEDFFFWLGIAIYLFWEIYKTSNGSIRWYFVLGVVFGGTGTLFLFKGAEKMRKYLRKKLLRNGKKQGKI